MPHQNRINPLFLQKRIGLSLSHLVWEILWPKVGLICHQNVLFNIFYAFCINFLLDCHSNWPSFSLILDLFDLSFFLNLRSDWVQFFLWCVEPSYQFFSEEPPPHGVLYVCVHVMGSRETKAPVQPCCVGEPGGDSSEALMTMTMTMNDNDNDNENTLFDHNIQIEITIYKQFK